MSNELIMVILSILGGFGISALLGKFLIPALRALKAGQSIKEIGPTWHNNKSGTPTMGGLMFMAASLLCIVTGIWSGQWTQLIVLALALMFGAIGFVDDFIKVKKKRNLGLTSLQKLLLQVVASVIFLLAMHFAGAMSYELRLPFVEEALCTLPAPLYIAFAVFVIIGCVNAVNITDGIDGLASGVTSPVMLFFVVAAMGLGQNGLATFPAALLGGLAGFLVYNFYPAEVFMGDTGSLFLGGAVVGLAFALDMPLVLLLVGIIYIIETLSDILQVGYFKLTHGKRIFKMAPIHHHFEKCGWGEIKIVTVFSALTLILCAVAWIALK